MARPRARHSLIRTSTAAFQTAVVLWRRFLPRPGDLSLRTRLRLFVLMLMFSVVTALSLLHLYTLGAFGFEDVLQRAQNIGHEVKGFVSQRLREMVYDLPPARRAEAPRTLYASLLEGDEELPVFLRDIGSNSRAIVEISISDASGRILADSLPYRVGQRTARLPDFEAWAGKGPWQKLAEIFSERRDYQVMLPIAEQGKTTPVFSIDVVLSSVLLREIVLPQVRSVALIFLGALLLSLLLAVIVSNLVLRPLDNISQAIDRISQGDFASQPGMPDGTAKEFAAVQSKLNLLGQQYRGARQDAIQLRSNVEQLLERLEEVVLLFDPDDRLVMAGRAAESILGRGRWEIMGRTLTEIFPPSSALGAALRNAIELRQPLKDVALTLEDGPGTRVLVSAEMLEAFPDRQRIGALITLRDAETRRQIRSQLDVSARLAAISRLTGGVAHEIKNPLQAITVHMEVLKSKLAGQYDEVGVEIETIAREILRLDRVVKTFLDFTRPVDLKMRDVGMVALAQDVAALVGPSAARQNVRIELDAEPGETFVHGDRDLLQQAILNVVVNGVEAMKNGGLLRIQLLREGDECCVSISDEGAGIPPEIRERIFHLYFTTKGKGSGIGLAMTFRVVQLHNGTIDFTSESGRGATFRLRIPAIYKEQFGGAQYTAEESALGD
jgi:signal transduction histidine kinase/HAMP domain-containing protein